MNVLETERLILRELSTNDGSFILQLVNEPSWLQYICDKGIRTVEAAQDYIQKGPVAMYARYGFGLWLVELKVSSASIGICGLIKRDALEDVDIGFAFLPNYWRKGYAFESASGTLAHGRSAFGLKKIVAIMAADNYPSHCLLEKLGFRFERMIRLSDNSPEIKLYASSL